jgi:hypothetical protein
MTPRHLILPALFGLVLSATVQAQQATPLQQRMSPSEFKAAGLDKLSAQELDNLDAWLRAHAKVTTRVVTASGAPLFYPDASKRQKIEARVNGRFDGWNGRNTLTLDNGQQWKQIGSDDVSCNASDNPSAKIKPSMLGGWLAYVKGCNGSVHVERVR